MSRRKKIYNWWVNNRKHQAADIIYGSYTKISNKTNYLIRESKRNSLVIQYNKCDSAKERWNLIHKFGVTRKSKKSEARNIKIDDDFSVDNLNRHFTKLEPLPVKKLNLPIVNTKFDFEIVSPVDIIRIIGRKITSNSTGPDGIPPKIFKLLSAHLASPISIIINYIFILSGIFSISTKKHFYYRSSESGESI